MQMMPSNLRHHGFVFVQGVFPLNTTLPEKCQPRCEDANARARDGVGCENDRNKLGCVIGCENGKNELGCDNDRKRIWECDCM